MRDLDPVLPRSEVVPVEAVLHGQRLRIMSDRRRHRHAEGTAEERWHNEFGNEPNA